jgi:vacuolar-type H+-ATPase subunit B/Vma2
MVLQNSKNNEILVVKKVSTEGQNILTARFRDIDHFKRKLVDTSDWDTPKMEHVPVPDMETRLSAAVTVTKKPILQILTDLAYSILKEIRFTAEQGWADFDETAV